MKKLILIATLVVISFTFLHADVYIKSKVHTDAIEIMGQKQPAKDEITEQWIGNNTFAQKMAAQSTVVDLDKNLMYIIFHASKSYVEAQLPLDLSKLLPPEMAPMLQMIKVTIKVAPSGETKKIGNWNCQGYHVNMNVTMMEMKMKIWATTDVPFDWKKFQDKMYPAVMKATMAQMNLDEAAINEFKKIKGFQVASEINMAVMGTNVGVTSQVLEISKKPAPAGIYAPPPGYSKKDKLSMTDMKR